MNILDLLLFKNRLKVGDEELGNDLPSQGGISGNLPRTTGPYTPDTTFDMNQESNVMPEVQYSMGKPIDPNQMDEEEFNKLRNLQAPNRADYKPTKMREFSAMMAGLGQGSGPAAFWGGVPVGFKGDIEGGRKLEQSMLDEPYDEAYKDYEHKLKPLQETAKLENQRNNVERQARANESTTQRYYDELARKEARDAVLARQGDARIDIAEKNAATAEARMKVYADMAKGGVLESDEVTGKTYMVYKDGTKKDVDLNVFDDREKQEMINRAAMARTQLQQAGANTRNAATIAGQNERAEEHRWSQPFIVKGKDGEETYHQVNLDTGESRPVKITGEMRRIGTDREETPFGQAKELSNRALTIINNNPELKDYFVIGGNKLPTGELKPADNWFGKADDMARYNKAKKLLLGGALAAGNQQATVPNNTLPKGKIRVVGPNGEKGTMDESELSKFPDWHKVE